MKPDFAEAYNNLGATLREQDKFDQALAQFERAIALKPDYAEAHKNRGTTLKQQGKLEQALACLDQALVLNPDYAEAALSLRRFENVSRRRRRSGRTLKRWPLKRPSGAPDKMLYLHFALGKALEDVGEYQRAFEHLLAGNTMKCPLVDYDEAEQERAFAAIAEIFDEQFFDRFPTAGDPSPVPIFVLGMPRSGSTLTEQILASHPQVHAAGEIRTLGGILWWLTDAAGNRGCFPKSIEGMDAENLRQMAQAYLTTLPPLTAGKERVTDKTPNNYLYLGLIHMILPNARIIHTVRDPVDTCVSCFSRLFAMGQPFSYDLGELGRHYRRYHEMMKHWRSVLPPGAMLDMAYEETVADLEGQARRLIDYCGLPWDDRCLSFHKTSRPVRTASNVQVRRPLYSSSVERRRRYEPYLEPLLTALAECRESAGWGRARHD